MTKVIILHGWTYSTEKWSHFTKLMAAHYEVELLKIPGLTEDLRKVWNLDDYVEWLKKKVDSEDKVILIGHSNGGRISLAYTLKYPDKIFKLILIDSAGIYHNELPIRFKRFMFKSLAKLGKKFTSWEKLKILLYKLAREGDYKNATPTQRQTMLNLINIDATQLLSKVKVPTLIIWGKNDKITPLSDGKLMHHLIKNSKLKIINDAKHSPQFTHPKEVAEKIYEYL